MATKLGDRAIGAAMRAYRRSPLHPTWGKALARVLSRLPGSDGLVVREIDGVRFELDRREVIDSSLYYSGTFEPATERAISDLLAPGMTALDIGANIGYHTFRIAQGVGPAGRVLAVEPMTTARRRLERNLALNPQLDNITVSPVGITDTDGRAEVAFQSSYRLDGRDVIDTESVELITLDSLVERFELARVDFIKVDVDGYEGKLVRGGTHTLETWRPTLVFEVWPIGMRRNDDDPVDLIARLESLGYSITTEDGEPLGEPATFFDDLKDNSTNLIARAGAQQP